MSRVLGAAVAAIAFSAPAWAHHGFGTFDATKNITLHGTLTRLDFVNPHAYVYFDVLGPDGKVTPMRCEMRAATVLRRSGWSPKMFVVGARVTVKGHPNRVDPASCYVETLAIGDAPAIKRYAQLDSNSPAKRQYRPLRLPSGEPNISGDWAEEQYLLAFPPGARHGALVPKSLVAAVDAGDLPLSQVPNAGWGARPVTFTAAGRAAAEAQRKAPPQDNPRMHCKITSILFDWVFDGPINRITQRPDEITLQYGRGLERTIHMNMTSHPKDLTPSRAGHSIGHWEGDTLVVDTVGFLPGMLVSPVMNSAKLHVVERFTLDPKKMALRRDYVAEDPVYYTGKYVGSDTVLPADAPFAVDRCKELSYLNYSKETEE